MDDESIDYASDDYAAGFRDGHDLHKSVRGTLIEQLTTAQSEAAELRKEVERLGEALRVIAERPGPGEDRWRNAINENDHMAEIAQDTLEGNEHHTVRYFKDNRWPETQHEG